MKTYTLKSVARRGTMLAAAFMVAGATILPAVSVSADALNPLTERSLTLSTASPGWSYKDASGNATYAPPNSGANGRQTGNTFSFRVSSNATVKGMSFQYCTFAAGDCIAPGNVASHGPNDATAFAAKTSDLEIVTASPSEVTPEYFTDKFDPVLGQPKASPGWTGITTNVDPALRLEAAHPNIPNRDNSEGNFIVLHKVNKADNWTRSAGWTMAATENQQVAGSTGKENYITLSNATGLSLTRANYVKVMFFATNTNFITNPGGDEFFVKINTFSTKDPALFETDTEDPLATIIDGGVTVANVMNRSIEIQTKVLETMDFSVGTVDPVTLQSTGAAGSQLALATGKTRHTPCTAIAQGMGGTSTLPANVLQLGSETGEFSLETDQTYSTHSYWRLSSNSSGGATVYYSGITLSNTVGDQIDAIGTSPTAPLPGKEQFGLALDHERDANGAVSYAKERDNGFEYQNGADNSVTGIHGSFATDMAIGPQVYHTPRLAPLKPVTGYGEGAGVVNADHYSGAATRFVFDSQSSMIPTPFAEGTEVLNCVTGKMRYIANIAATTPAGVYTTKINYIASPQY